MLDTAKDSATAISLQDVAKDDLFGGDLRDGQGEGEGAGFGKEGGVDREAVVLLHA